MQTRRKARAVHWLLGTEDDRIRGSKLPSKRQALRFFLYNHWTLRKTIRESARATVNEMEKFYDRARIPTRQTYNSVNLVEKLYGKYRRLQKDNVGVGKGHGAGKAHENRKTEFLDSLDDFLDITRKRDEANKYRRGQGMA